MMRRRRTIARRREAGQPDLSHLFQRGSARIRHQGPDPTGGERLFIPPDPTANSGPLPKDVVAQTEDVLVDTRGYIYITDKNWGMWILRYSGPNQPTPTDR